MEDSVWMKGSGDEEKVLGGLEVEALLRLGSEHLFLLFTQTRIIMAHQGKIGRSTVPLYGFLGKMSEGLKGRPVKRGMLEKMAEMEPSGILGLHPDNFAVEYPRVVSVRVEAFAGGGRAKITLITADEKYELYASPVAVEGVRENLFSLLPGKTEYR